MEFDNRFIYKIQMDQLESGFADFYNRPKSNIQTLTNKLKEINLSKINLDLQIQYKLIEILNEIHNKSLDEIDIKTYDPDSIFNEIFKSLSLNHANIQIKLYETDPALFKLIPNQKNEVQRVLIQSKDYLGAYKLNYFNNLDDETLNYAIDQDLDGVLYSLSEDNKNELKVKKEHYEKIISKIEKTTILLNEYSFHSILIIKIYENFPELFELLIDKLLNTIEKQREIPFFDKKLKFVEFVVQKNLMCFYDLINYCFHKKHNIKNLKINSFVSQLLIQFSTQFPKILIPKHIINNSLHLLRYNYNLILTLIENKNYCPSLDDDILNLNTPIFKENWSELRKLYKKYECSDIKIDNSLSIDKIKNHLIKKQEILKNL